MSDNGSLHTLENTKGGNTSVRANSSVTSQDVSQIHNDSGTDLFITTDMRSNR